MNNHKHAVIANMTDGLLFVATTLFGWLASLPWAPLLTLVLIPAARFAGSHARARLYGPKLVRENEQHVALIAQLEERLFMREQELIRLRSDRARGPRESYGGHD